MEKQTPSRLPLSTTAGGAASSKPATVSRLGKRQLSHSNLSVTSTLGKRMRQTSSNNLATPLTGRAGSMRPPASSAALRMSNINSHNSSNAAPRLTRQKSGILTTSSTNTVAKPGVKPAGAGGGGGTKRPAWDLKGRVKDMEDNILRKDKEWAEERKELQSNIEKLVNAKHEVRVLEGEAKKIREEKSHFETELAEMRCTVSTREQELASVRAELSSEQLSKQSVQRNLDSISSELTAKCAECNALKESVGQLTAAQSTVQSQLSTSQLINEQLQQQLRLLEQQLSDSRAAVSRCEVELRDNETQRRNMHNTIQELKGNIRVFCRVRPLLPHEITDADSSASNSTISSSSSMLAGVGELPLSVLDSRSLEVRQGGKRGASDSRMSFSFDHVFSATSSQQHVFDELSHLIQSAMDGYNVCVFAYGQTGSGKTFTMEGGRDTTTANNNNNNNNNNDDTTSTTSAAPCDGMIPRAVRQIFESKMALLNKGWDYKLDASFVEIYNENIRDLLDSSKTSKTCEIRMTDGKSKEVYVTNLKTVSIESEREIELLMSQARRQRAVAATKCNERSSRSHSVFTLKLHAVNNVTGETSLGSLNLVDLAGSERVKESGSEGDRLSEAKCINKSLSNLGNVIMALAQKQEHVPYRNSKLTHLLQHSLGGNSKTLMMVNVSPRVDCVSETINSLRFAAKVNQCHIGTASRRVK